jgi:DNA-directed RNA polymerase specialized sigma24 family protein
MSAIRAEEYAAVVQRERLLIQATAYLLTGDPVQAERVVQLVFAQLYGRRHRMRDPHLEAIRAVVQAAESPVHLPWEHHERFELIDGAPPPPATEPIIADLSLLSYDQRAAVVLGCYAGLSTAQIADVLRLPVGYVLSLAARARNTLTSADPGRTTDETLAAELGAAIPYDLRESHGSANDVADGRRLARRRWVQRGSVVLVAALLLIVAAVLVVPARPPVPQAAPPSPATTPPTQTCEPSTATCRSYLLSMWRAKMVDVVSSYLDPTGGYFSGFRFSYDRHDVPGSWTDHGGALAFDMFRLDEGATEIYLQIATGRTYAVRCGATTHQKCMSIRFMDGNSYLMTDSTLADGGIEVQYSPNGDEVITVIARNTQRGRTLNIGSGDLIKLVQDERLRLPMRCCYRR